MVTEKFVLPLLSIVFLVLSTTAVQAETQTLDRIAAIVNDDIILDSELDTEINTVREKVAQTKGLSLSNSDIKEQAMERLIVKKLQLAEAKAQGIGVDDETLLKAITNVAERNKLSVAQLSELLRSEGMDMDHYRERLRNQIILSRLRNREVMSRIQVTDAEINNHLEHASKQPGGRTEVHMRHILVSTPEGASSDEIQTSRAQAEALIEQLQSGADFASLAIRHSAGKQSLEGGDLGWLDAAHIPSIFASDAATLDKGAVAGPFQTASGFHIIKLEDFKGGQRNIIKQTHARHILIRTDELTSDHDARSRLEQLLKRINEGADFAALARTNSSDKGSAIQGGDLDWVAPGSLVDEFETAMNSLDVNQISPPFKTQFGWHIVQVLDRRDHDATNDARRKNARGVLREQKADEALELYIRKLRSEAYVDIRPVDL